MIRSLCQYGTGKSEIDNKKMTEKIRTLHKRDEES